METVKIGNRTYGLVLLEKSIYDSQRMEKYGGYTKNDYESSLEYYISVKDFIDCGDIDTKDKLLEMYQIHVKYSKNMIYLRRLQLMNSINDKSVRLY